VLGIAAATTFFAATAALADFVPVAGIWVDSPESVLNGVIHDESSGLPAGVFVAVCGVLLGLISVALAWVPRPVAVLGLTIAIFAFGGSVAGYAFERLLTSRSPAGIPVTGQSRVRDWVDRATASDAAVVAAPISRDWAYSAVGWWEVEFWNQAVDQAFVASDGLFTYTPFPSRTLRLDFASGRFQGTDSAPQYVIVSQSDSRFGLAGSQAAANLGLKVIAVERPYRALWATRGLDPDGWTRPGRPATVRVYAQPGKPSERVRIAITLTAPPEAKGEVRYRLGDATGAVAPGAGVPADRELCVPAGGHADLTLTADRSATIAGPPIAPAPGPLRGVGVALSGVEITPTGNGCS